MKKVLIVAPNYYTSEFQVGSHHYARAFAKLGYEVAYISAPISPLHFFSSDKQNYNSRKDIYKKDGITKDGIWSYVPYAYIVPQNRAIFSSSFVLNHWYRFSKNSLVKILQQKGFDEVDILWLDSPIYHFFLESIKYKQSIFRLADSSKGLGAAHSFFLKEIKIANKVDKVIYTSKSILKWYKDIKPQQKMHYVPNGIDLHQFTATSKVKPKIYNTIQSPRVVYVGAIDKWFDIDLVYECAITYPEHSFILIGKHYIDITKLLGVDNIYILGPIAHDKITNYLHFADIGIIPFKQNEFVKTINPLKIYEYLASDLKIVSVFWDELNTLKDYCNLANSKEEFINYLKNDKDSDTVNPKVFLEKNTWDMKLKWILEQS